MQQQQHQPPSSRSDVCEYILYVVPGEKNSEHVMGLIGPSTRDDIWLQNARELGRPLPTWLDGVPILAHKPSGRLLRGTDCVAEIETLGANKLESYMGFTANLNHQSACTFADTGNSVGLSCQDVRNDMPPMLSTLDADVLTEKTLDDYMKLRNSQMSQSRQVLQEQSMEMVEIN
jgi:hypothetical protein